MTKEEKRKALEKASVIYNDKRRKVIESWDDMGKSVRYLIRDEMGLRSIDFKEVGNE